MKTFKYQSYREDKPFSLSASTDCLKMHGIPFQDKLTTLNAHKFSNINFGAKK